jgi:acyl carrier protein
MQTIKEDTKAKVRAFIQESILMGSRAAAFGDGDSFIEHHVIDSTGFLELITFLEEAYGIAVGDEEMVPENLDSLNAIEAYVARKLS